MKSQIPNSEFRIPNSVVHSTYYITHITICLLFALCSLPFAGHAQYFNPGTDPASVRWNQVKSKHYRIIYPRELDSIGVYVANAFEYFRAPGSTSMQVLPSKWPVILHNRTVISNGFTPYAPKRVELITTPPQDNEDTYAQNWIDQLVIHEFRHTVQYASVDRGTTRVLKYLLGQQALPGILGLFVPWWFIEGDAVVTETANSHTGRGRVPGFQMKLKAQFLEKGIYSYDKAVNGSYRDFIPNHYELGYLLVGQARVEFGRDIWNQVMRRTGNLPIIFVPFSNTLYRETGYGKSRFYQHITRTLQSEWESTDQAVIPTEHENLVNNPGKFYTDRTHPALLDDGRIVALKESIDDVPRIVVIDSTGREDILLNTGPMVDKNLSAHGNLLCWSELAYDARWQYRSYSVIQVYDVTSGKIRQVTHKSRYFAPDISRDGQKIVTVMVDESSRNFLVILDMETGDVINKFPIPGNYFPDHPSWSPNGEAIAVILTRSEGKCLAVMNALSGEFEFFLPFSNTEISKPFFSHPYIFFGGTYSGIDNIYALDLGTRELYQVTSSRFGATDAVVSDDGRLLYYADYSSKGFNIVKTSLNLKKWQKIDPGISHKWKLADQLSHQEGFVFDNEDVPDSAYIIKPYQKWQHLFNFHSWAPLALDIDNTTVNPGVTVMSQNLLGSSTATLNYSYDMNEQTGKYSLKYTYEGLYPAFDLSMDYGLRKGTFTDSSENKFKYKYHQLDLTTGIRVPLNWSIRSWWVGVQPYAGYTLSYLKMLPGSQLEFRRDRYNSLSWDLYLYAQSRMSERDIQPRWGQVLDVNYRSTIFDPEPLNSIFVAEGIFYIPGIVRHQGFKIYWGYQDRQQFYSTYPVLISTPRGYTHLFPDQAFSGYVSYAAPLFYPDWNAGPVFYLKRINASVFYDLMLDFDYNPDTYYQSTGLDVTFDFHLFRWFVPFEAGLRTIYVPDGARWEFEFLYSINIGDLY